ncbi:pilus assembly protein PilN [Komagataeibacter sp. FNDCR2]|uniref:pilus assembly protein PilN n=1 Tax=Komagataeibacter sp. FNDCR2 TaxID=2878682 RepID=UPI001E3C76C9|nr:pilus assembly protein PilN [Komagataeibacter sp. FNDCR2]MCE2576665.1 pilus assembly protein PilN [Komagataeibacter sp. FNDCR2]
MKPFLTLAGSCALLALLAGCTDFRRAHHAEDSIQKFAQENHVPDQPVVTFSDRPWLLGDSIREVDPVPDTLLRPAGLTFARPMSLRDIVMAASRVTTIPVKVAPDADDYDTGNDADSAPATTPVSFNGTTLPPPPGATATGMTPRRSGGSSRNPETTWSHVGTWFDYHGTREGLFQTIATRFGISQRWVDDHIEFFRYQTKTFPIPAFAGKTTSNNSIIAYTGGGNGSSSGMGGMGGGMGGGMSGGMSSGGMGGGMGGSGGSSGQSMGMGSIYSQSETDRWKNLEKTAQTVSNGAQVVADDGLGTLTVTGTPDQVARVDDWVRALSDNMLKQVAIEVHVYTVKVSRESNYGFSPQMSFTSHGGLVGLTSTPAAIPALQTTDTPFSFGASILSTGKGTGGLFSGSKVVVQALQRIGNVTEQYDRSAVTTNGSVAPFQNGINTTYLENATALLQSWRACWKPRSVLRRGVVDERFQGSAFWWSCDPVGGSVVLPLRDQLSRP